jgi:hypothetical protein
MNDRFYIVNSFDAPIPRLIAEKVGDQLFYIHPELREKWKNQGLTLHSEATPIENFGIHFAIKDGMFHGQFLSESTATYPDGRRRVWQGDPNFFFRYPGPPGTPMNTPFNVLDVIPNPRDVGSSEYAAIYELLDAQECFQDPEFSMAVLEEVKLHAQACIDKIEAALLERFALGY